MFRLLPGGLQQMQSSCEKFDVYYMGELQTAWIVGKFENVETLNGILMKKVFRMFKILTTKCFFFKIHSKYKIQTIYQKCRAEDCVSHSSILRQQMRDKIL